MPRSHCFISLAHGRSIRTIRVRTGLFRSGVAAAALLGLWTLGSTAYLVLHDDLLASLMARETRMQYAYEDRIAALRGQVEHEASLKLVNQSTIETQVRELARRAANLEIRASLVSDLASKLSIGKPEASARGRDPEAAPLGAADVAPAQNTANVPAATAPPRKPHPEAMIEDGLKTAAAETQPLRLRLATVTEALEHVDAAQYARIAAIGARARKRLDAIRTAVASVGLSPDRFQGAGEGPAAGGPFVPLSPSISGSPFGQAVEALQADVVGAQSLSRALPRLPFAKPLDGAMEVTSPFGARLDPFLGRPAMHTGVDLREEAGTEVRTTAAGRVVSAGMAGGYGVMVEVDHGHGLSTRYAHLSAVSVEPGQIVYKGEPVGQVGSTGRATGPHLHYETRIDGEAVDPTRFLAAGERLAALDALP